MAEQYPVASLFLVDPCGIIDWNPTIEKICEWAGKNPYTEMILNWSWDAVNRNLTTKRRRKVLSRCYGVALRDVDDEFQNFTEMQQYLDKYLAQLNRYFKYACPIGVPKEHKKIKPKAKDFRKYYLIFCTNSKNALKLAEYKADLIEKELRQKFVDLNGFIGRD